MRVLGLVTHTHDTGIALLRDGVPELVIEEERLNRQKKTTKFPKHALDAAFTDRGLAIGEVEAITMPWHIPTLVRTLGRIVLRRFPSSLNMLRMRAHPTQRNRLILGTRYLASRLRRHFKVRRLPPVIGIGHHDAHAAGTFFVSPFEEATVLVMDGYGDDSATSVYVGRGNHLQRRWRSHVLNSLGIVYTVVTQHLGFRPNRDEGTVMGLAAYGTRRLVEPFRDLIHLRADGHYQVNMDYFTYDRYGQYRPVSRKFIDRFGPPRQADAELTDDHKDVACALQATAEDAILHVVRHVTKTHKCRKLCLSGGVALNCVANARILAETEVEKLWIPPNPSDTGTVLGSALWHYHQNLGHERCFVLEHPFFGCEYGDAETRRALKSAGFAYQVLNEQALIDRVAADLEAGKIVGWFQGRFEMGPRALGNRSILADPRRAKMKDILNARVKHRAWYRPFAPAVLVDRCAEFFEISQGDPFMTIAPKVRPDKAHLIPAVVHSDGTARVQTIERASNPRYYRLIEAFGRRTGVPILLNTSFNRQEPIVARPAEAVACFQRTDMDVLVLGDHYVSDRNRAGPGRPRAARA